MNFYLNKIMSLFVDDEIDEVLINSTRSCLVQYKDHNEIEESLFESTDTMIKFIQDFSFSMQARIDPMHPVAGGICGEGAYRWHAIIPPVSPEGPLFCVRRQRLDSLSLEDFGCDPKVRLSLERVWLKGSPLLICGPTGSGKTSLLSALLKEFSLKERVVLIEDYQEIQLHSKGWFRLLEQSLDVEGRFELSLDQCLEAALRLRPDRFVIGEIRNYAACVFLDASLTGHNSVATIHATSVEEVLHRISLFFLREKQDSLQETLKNMISKVSFVFLKRGQPPTIEIIEGS